MRPHLRAARESARTGVQRHAWLGPREQVQVPLPRLVLTPMTASLSKDPTPRPLERVKITWSRRRPSRRRQGPSATGTSLGIGDSRTRFVKYTGALTCPKPTNGTPASARRDAGPTTLPGRSIFRHELLRDHSAQPRPSSQRHGLAAPSTPSKMRRHGIRYRHTWCRAALTFLLETSSPWFHRRVLIVSTTGRTGEYAYCDLSQPRRRRSLRNVMPTARGPGPPPHGKGGGVASSSAGCTCSGSS